MTSVRDRLWLPVRLIAGLSLAAGCVVGQGIQTKDVMGNGKLTAGFDEGVNSSGGRTDYVTPNDADNSQKMSCPPNQAWCAVWVSWGPSVDPPRPGTDMSAFATLLVEIRGDAGQTAVWFGVKSNTQPDDGSEQKVKILLTKDWRTYAIPLTNFSRANLKLLYLVWEIVWDPNSTATAYVRTIRYTTARAPAADHSENAASYQRGMVAGAWNSVMGADLSTTTRGWANGDFNGKSLPLVLDGNSVQIGERNMGVYYISPAQINTLVFGDVPAGSNYLTVTTPVGTSVPVPVSIQALMPAIFTIGPSNNYAAAVHLNGTIVGKAGLYGTAATTAPAAPGETVEVFATGLGATAPPTVQDQIIESPIALANASQWQARIGNVTATVSYAGLVGSGLYQFNVVIPSVADGDQPIVISNGSVSTQSGVSITVQK